MSARLRARDDCDMTSIVGGMTLRSPAGGLPVAGVSGWAAADRTREKPMAKKSRKKKARKNSKANHGKRPNS
jgi:hypothetical protein